MIKILPRGRIRLPLPETFAYITHSVRMSLGVYGISALGVEALCHGSISMVPPFNVLRLVDFR